MTRTHIPGETIPQAEYEAVLRSHADRIAEQALTLCDSIPPHIEQITRGSVDDFYVIWLRNRHTYQELESWSLREIEALGSRNNESTAGS